MTSAAIQSPFLGFDDEALPGPWLHLPTAVGGRVPGDTRGDVSDGQREY